MCVSVSVCMCACPHVERETGGDDPGFPGSHTTD